MLSLRQEQGAQIRLKTDTLRPQATQENSTDIRCKNSDAAQLTENCAPRLLKPNTPNKATHEQLNRQTAAVVTYRVRVWSADSGTASR